MIIIPFPLPPSGMNPKRGRSCRKKAERDYHAECLHMANVIKNLACRRYPITGKVRISHEWSLRPKSSPVFLPATKSDAEAALRVPIEALIEAGVLECDIHDGKEALAKLDALKGTKQ